MSIYEGKWPEKSPFTENDIVVLVDNLPLPPFEKEIPGLGDSFAWGDWGRWADRKLLAYSILFFELHNVLGLTYVEAFRDASSIGGVFLEDKVVKLDNHWTLTSDDLRGWIKAKYPDIWHNISQKFSLSSHRA